MKIKEGKLIIEKEDYKLEELDLTDNQLTELPKEIWKLKNLKRLELSYNQLTELPPEIGNLENLEELDLSSNQLTTLPKELGKLESLKHIYLYGNKFSEEEEEKIKALLVNVKICLPKRAKK